MFSREGSNRTFGAVGNIINVIMMNSEDEIEEKHLLLSDTHLDVLRDQYNAGNQGGEDFHLKLMEKEPE